MSTVEAGPSGPLVPDGDAVQAAPAGETLKALGPLEEAPANADAFAVLFRNVAIACAALALAVQTRDARRTGRYAARR